MTLTSLLLIAVAQVAHAATSPGEFDKAMLPCLQARGVRWHNEEMQEGAFRIDKLSKNVGTENSPPWLEVMERINLSGMPPKTEATTRADEWLNVAKPAVPADEAARLQRKLSMVEADKYGRLFFDLMVMALRTGSTRVITCGMSGEGHASGIPEIGILQTRHGLSHRNGNPGQLRRLTATDTFLVEQLSDSLDQLQQHKEGDQPLLDTTQVLWGSGMACGHSHGNANLPTILCDGKTLGCKHGTHVDFNLPKIGRYDLTNAQRHDRICSRPVDTDARLSNLLLTMPQRVDVKADKFQDSLGPVTGVLGA